MLALTYINQNFLLSVASLATLDILKNKYELGPEQLQYYSSLLILPWIPKFLYGAFTDNLAIFGSTKKSYIIIMGILTTVSGLIVSLVEFDSPGSFILIVMLLAASAAVTDVVVDGAMVVQSRRDP